MTRKLLISLPLVAMLATTACSKDEAGKDGTVAATPAEGATAATPPGGWKGIERVSFTQLQQLFPATVGGQPRTELGGSAQAAEDPWTEATATYGNDTKYVNAKVEDNPQYATELLAARTGSLKNHAVVGQSESDGSSVLQLVVASRFHVHLAGTGFTITELKTWAESLDLAKLESWKDHGRKK